MKIKYIVCAVCALSSVVTVAFPAFMAKLNASNVMSYNITLSNENIIDIADGYGETTTRYTTFAFSNVEQNFENLIKINDRGLLYNKTAINSLESVAIDFDEETFNGATLYYGNYLLSFENSINLNSQNNIDIPNGNSFFTIRSNGENIIKNVNVCYSCEKVYDDYQIPILTINTEKDDKGNYKQINSRVDYSNCTVSVFDENDTNNNINKQAAGIRIRGNSTASQPKKPYRIKFDKKQKMFGMKKAKSWCLLADYMDGSSMHNFAALSFSKAVRGNEFTPSPFHVNVMLNGEDIGLYLFTENIDEKEGRMDIEESNEYFLSQFDDDLNFDFSKIPFMIERDYSAIYDSTEILNETYFKTEQSDSSIYYYSLKYPKKENFYLIEDDETSFQSDKYYKFFNYLKTYMTNLYEMFKNLNDKVDGSFETLSSFIDVYSLSSFALTDIFAREEDHAQKSFKMYKCKDDNLLKFGATWDYDSCSFGLYYQGKPVDNPLSYPDKSYYIWCGDYFSRVFANSSEGKNIMSNTWESVRTNVTEKYVKAISSEIEHVSNFVINDSHIWYNSKDYMVFDNIVYLFQFIIKRVQRFNNYFKIA